MNEKRVTSVAQKVLLQLNCKLGGELWSCTTPFKELMVVGIDVFNDKTRKSGGSLVGVVSTINSTLSRYYSVASAQQQGQDLSDTLKIVFLDCLVKYWEQNQTFPKNIVVFRDGVGDGQLEVTEKHEAEQFLRTFAHVRQQHDSLKGSPAMSKLKGLLPDNYAPGFTYVVVQKRINARMYSVRPQGPKV